MATEWIGISLKPLDEPRIDYNADEYKMYNIYSSICETTTIRCKHLIDGHYA